MSKNQSKNLIKMIDTTHHLRYCLLTDGGKAGRIFDKRREEGRRGSGAR